METRHEISCLECGRPSLGRGTGLWGTTRFQQVVTRLFASWNYVFVKNGRASLGRDRGLWWTTRRLVTGAEARACVMKFLVFKS